MRGHLFSGTVTAPTRPGIAPLLPPIRAVLPPPDQDVVCTVTALDDRGRLGDRSVIRALGWAPGDPVTVALLPAAAGLRVTRGNGDTICTTGRLRLPIDARHALHLAGGDRLLIVAHPGRDELVAYTMAAVTAMTALLHDQALRPTL